MANEAPKPWWKSKTILLNLIAMVVVVIPQAREWVEANPVPLVSVLTALNLLVRFVTSGKISVFDETDDDESANGSTAGTGVSDGKTAAGRDAGGVAANGNTHMPGSPWLVALACAAFGLCVAGCAVGVDSAGGWSIRPDPYSVDAVLKHAIRNEDDSAKSGLKRTTRGGAKAAEVNAEK